MRAFSWIDIYYQGVLASFKVEISEVLGASSTASQFKSKSPAKVYKAILAWLRRAKIHAVIF